MAFSEERLYGRFFEHMEFLSTCGVPLYIRYSSRDFPTDVEYPLEEVYSNSGCCYLTPTALENDTVEVVN